MLHIPELIKSIQQNKFNHHNQQHIALDHLEAASQGEFYVNNATSPIVALLEHNTASCVVNNLEVDSLLRDLTRENAKTIDSLVRHVDMSVKNLIRAKPGTMMMTLSLRVADIIQRGVLLANKGRRIIIPEDTVIAYKDDLYFGIHHAIEITYHSDDNIDVRYLDNENPLYELENPVLDINYREPDDLANVSRERLLEVNLKVFQMRRDTHLHTINKVSGFSESYLLDDQYYHARVFSRSGNSWVELNTEIGEFAYSPSDNVGTAVVHFDDNQLIINIPQIYINRGIIGNQVKVVLYTTRGNITQNFGMSLPADFSIEFVNNNPQQANYVGPLAAFGTLYIGGRDTLSGGSDMPTVEQIRQSLLNPISTEDIPITRADLRGKLVDKDYSLVHEHNYVDRNLYIASKRLPPVIVGCTEIQIASGGINVALTNITNISGVVINGDNFTITPKVIGKYVDGRVNFLSHTDNQAFNRLGLDKTINGLNTETYLTTPFYYLLERGEVSHGCSVFDLDTPEVVERHYITTNNNVEGLISTRDYSIRKEGDTYVLELTAIVNDSFLQYPDDSFVPQLRALNEFDQAFGINGVFSHRGDDGEFVYLFTLPTKYDLDDRGTIVIDTLVGPSGKYPMPLTCKFDLTYNQVSYIPPENDTTLKEVTVPSLLPQYYLTLTHETMTLKLGEMLSEIYTPTRSLLGRIEYQHYDVDVLAYHSVDQYVTDEDGFDTLTPNPNYDVNDPNSDPFIFTIEHHKGDPILDAHGNHVVKHHAGDLVLDSKGDPVPTKRQHHAICTRLILIDLKYRMVGTYMDDLRKQIVNQLHTDITPMQDKMIDLSELKYNLGTCLGEIKVRQDRNRSYSLPANLSFNFIVNVDKVTYGNIHMRYVITDAIKMATCAYLKRRTYARNEHIALINKEIASSVVSFDITSICDRTDIVSFTIEDDSDLMGLGGRVYVDTDGNMQLTSSIEINYEIS